jgi:tripartite-type tricarboxylate transporter receptor subunit TctC
MARRLLRNALFAVFGLWIGGAAAQSPALVQGYPNRPIRFIVTFPPGGSTDLVARAIAPRLSERLGQQILVDNRPGAGGSIGMDMVAKAAPDGYTIGLGAAGALAVNVSLYSRMPFDPVKDLTPVCMVAMIPFLLVAHPSVPANSLGELLTLAKAKPGQLSLGHGGNGTAMHLSGELLRLMAGVDFAQVPYKGSGPAATDVIAGQLPLAVVDVPSALAQVKAGRLKALGVTTAQRIFAAPEIPTLAESGVPGYESTGWFGVVAPAGTPPGIVARLNAEIVSALKDPVIRDRVLAAGAEPAPGTPEEFAALIKSEIPKWARVIKVAGVKVD